MCFAPARGAQVIKCLLIDRKVTGRRAVLWRHIGNHSALTRRERGHTRPEIFDEFARYADFAQSLRDHQRKIGGQHTGTQRACEPHTDHIGNGEHRGHAEHDRLRLQPAYAPAKHPNAIDHRRVAVGSDHHVRHGPTLAIPHLGGHDSRQLLQIEGMHDASAWRMHMHVVQRL